MCGNAQHLPHIAYDLGDRSIHITATDNRVTLHLLFTQILAVPALALQDDTHHIKKLGTGALGPGTSNGTQIGKGELLFRRLLKKEVTERYVRLVGEVLRLTKGDWLLATLPRF